MTVRYYCPVSTCGWHHDEVDPEPPTMMPLNRIPGAALALLTERYMTVEKIVGAHLECHPRLDFVQEIGLQRARAAAAEANCNSLRDALAAVADFTGAMDAHTTQRMPSRFEVEAVKSVLLDALGEAMADV